MLLSICTMVVIQPIVGIPLQCTRKGFHKVRKGCRHCVFITVPENAEESIPRGVEPCLPKEPTRGEVGDEEYVPNRIVGRAPGASRLPLVDCRITSEVNN